MKTTDNESNTACIISTVHPPRDQRILHKQAMSLLNDGWDVSFIVHSPNAEVRDGVNILSLGEASSIPQRWTHMYRAYKIAAEIEADVYHLHDPELLPVGYILKQRTDAAVIFDMHEDFVGNMLTEGHRKWIPPAVRPVVARLFPLIFSLFISRIDAVITTTDSMAVRVDELGAKKVELVRNFPKIQGLNIDTKRVQRDHECQLVYVGGLTEERGIMRMLQTLERLQKDLDIGLWLLGTFTDDNEESRAVEYIDEKNLNVRRFGYVEYNDIFPILSTADVGFVLLDATLCEHNISTKMFEYMYTETPYIGTDAPTIREYTDEDVGVLVPQDDISAAVAAIKSLFEDQDRIQQMGKQGRKKVESQYNWQSEFMKMMNLYTDLCDNDN